MGRGLLHYEWWLVGGPEHEALNPLAVAFVQQVNHPDSSQFRLMSRDYLKKSYALSGSKNAKTGLAPERHPNPCRRISTSAVERLSLLGACTRSHCSNTLMVWFWMILCGLTRTGRSWSGRSGTDRRGATRHPSGTRERQTSRRRSLFSRMAKALQHGKNERTSLTNGATLAEALAGLEIAGLHLRSCIRCMEFNKSDQELLLGSQSHCRRCPKRTALLAWISNPSNDVNVQPPTPIPSRLAGGTVKTWVDVRYVTTNAACCSAYGGL